MFCLVTGREAGEELCFDAPDLGDTKTKKGQELLFNTRSSVDYLLGASKGKDKLKCIPGTSKIA